MKISDNILQRRIGIFYRDIEWRNKVWEKLVLSIPTDIIFKSWLNNHEASIYRKDGSIIIFVSIKSGCRQRYDRVYFQPDINDDVLETIVYPCWVVRRPDKLVIDLVNNAPTIEPERKPGKWIDGKCDQCGCHAPYWSMSTTYYKSNYCPECGVKMEEPEDIPMEYFESGGR